MQPIRGTILVCDRLYRSTDHKFIIAGTYHTWVSCKPKLHLTGGIHVYVRYQVESAGEYPARILLIDRGLPSTVPPLMEMQFENRISDPLSPIECGFTLPEFGVKSPKAPSRIRIGQPLRMSLTLWLEVRGTAVASTPLNFIFRNPKDNHGHKAQIPPDQSPGATGRPT